MTALLVRLGAISPPARLALALLGLALVGAGSALFFLAPARARTAALEARRETLQREVAQARTAAKDLARHRREGVELHRRLELITQKLPTEREIPPLYRRLYDAAASTGLAVALFQPREARVQDYYTAIPIAVTAEGTYHQLGTFLERVAALPRVVTVSALKMTALERPAVSLRAEMTLATYVYRPVEAPPAPKPGPAKQPAPPPSLHRRSRQRTTVARAPQTASPAPGPAPTSSTTIALEPLAPALPGYSSRGRRDPFRPVSSPGAENADPATSRRSTIASATLTGIVRGPDGLLALVEMPDGIGYILRAGDGIGEGRLIQIRPDSVVFDIPSRPGLGGEQIVLALRSAR